MSKGTVEFFSTNFVAIASNDGNSKTPQTVIDNQNEKGVKKQDVASMFGVSQRTIYRLIK